MFHNNVFVIDDRQNQTGQYMPSPKQYGGALGLQLRGRLGNQMFQYASILDLASMMKFEKVIIEGSHELRDTFKLEKQQVEFGKVPPYWTVVRSTQSGIFDETLTQLNNKSELHI
ncbi:hypothetical protein DPMN_008745 [Dreissena polymorpha]|uniref:Uncharacterized protein n=1 Tax=Dreissena polymorpha TaxID=45954 RepID=A0A9D4RXM8_DREPO|nr:hypothetical protein DPMN_008745 [Dreissena polymorpha]